MLKKNPPSWCQTLIAEHPLLPFLAPSCFQRPIFAEHQRLAGRKPTATDQTLSAAFSSQVAIGLGYLPATKTRTEPQCASVRRWQGRGGLPTTKTRIFASKRSQGVFSDEPSVGCYDSSENTGEGGKDTLKSTGGVFEEGPWKLKRFACTTRPSVDKVASHARTESILEYMGKTYDMYSPTARFVARRSLFFNHMKRQVQADSSWDFTLTAAALWTLNFSYIFAKYEIYSGSPETPGSKKFVPKFLVGVKGSMPGVLEWQDVSGEWSRIPPLKRKQFGWRVLLYLLHTSPDRAATFMRIPENRQNLMPYMLADAFDYLTTRHIVDKTRPSDLNLGQVMDLLICSLKDVPRLAESINERVFSKLRPFASPGQLKNLVQHLEHHKVALDRRTAIGLAEALFKSGDISQGLRALRLSSYLTEKPAAGYKNHIMRSPTNPEADHYAALMLIAVEREDFGGALQALREMRGKGVELNAFGLRVLIRACRLRTTRDVFEDIGQLCKRRAQETGDEWAASEYIQYVVYYCYANELRHVGFELALREYLFLFEAPPLEELLPGLLHQSDDRRPSAEGQHALMTPSWFTLWSLVACRLYYLPPNKSGQAAPLYANFRHLITQGQHKHPATATLAEQRHMYDSFLRAFCITPRLLTHAAHLIADMGRDLPPSALSPPHNPHHRHNPPPPRHPPSTRQPYPSIKSWTILLSGLSLHRQPAAVDDLLAHLRATPALAPLDARAAVALVRAHARLDRPREVAALLHALARSGWPGMPGGRREEALAAARAVRRRGVLVAELERLDREAGAAAAAGAAGSTAAAGEAEAQGRAGRADGGGEEKEEAGALGTSSRPGFAVARRRLEAEEGSGLDPGQGPGAWESGAWRRALLGMAAPAEEAGCGYRAWEGTRDAAREAPAAC